MDKIFENSIRTKLKKELQPKQRSPINLSDANGTATTPYTELAFFTVKHANDSTSWHIDLLKLVGIPIRKGLCLRIHGNFHGVESNSTYKWLHLSMISKYIRCIRIDFINNKFPGFSGNDHACANSHYQAISLLPRGPSMWLLHKMFT